MCLTWKEPPETHLPEKSGRASGRRRLLCCIVKGQELQAQMRSREGLQMCTGLETRGNSDRAEGNDPGSTESRGARTFARVKTQGLKGRFSKFPWVFKISESKQPFTQC